MYTLPFSKKLSTLLHQRFTRHNFSQNNIFLRLSFFYDVALNAWQQDLQYPTLAAKKGSNSWRIQQNPLSGILKLSTIFNMNLREFLKLLLRQMQGIVSFSKSHRLNRNYFSLSILLYCSANNSFRFLLKWLASEFLPCASARLNMPIIFIITVIDVVCAWRGTFLNFWYFRFP